MSQKIENIVHNNLGQILTTNKKFKRGIFLLKASNNFLAKCKTVDKLAEVSLVYNKYIFGNPIPDNIESLGFSNSNFYTEDIISEVQWLLLSFRKYKAELSIFLTYKNDFENLFLRGQYNDALEVVKKIERMVGYSFWSITSKFLIYEYLGLQEQSKILLSDIIEKNKKGFYTKSLLQYLSQRSERKLSAYKFDNDLDLALKNAKDEEDEEIDQANKDYYRFQLNFFQYLSYPEIKSVLCFDFQNSVIDKYLTFRRAIIYCIANGIKVPEIVKELNFLKNKIHDDIFNSLRLVYERGFKSKTFFDSDYLKILDLYYSGLYEDVITDIKKYIEKSDVDFNLLNIYARSVSLSKVTFTPLVEGKCLVNEITENIYKLYQRNSKPSEIIYNLYQISKNINAFDISYQLDSFIKQEENTHHNPNYFPLACRKADPILINYLKGADSDKVEALFNKVKSETFNSIAINYKLNTWRGEYEGIKGIAYDKIEIDKAKHLFQEGDYSGALILWEKMYLKHQNTPPLLEASIDYIFRILANTQRYYDCIKWYVDSYIQNPHLVYKIIADDVHKNLRKARFKNVTIDLYLPLFISLVSNDENEKSFAIELFCKNNNAVFPSDYVNSENFEINAYTELFYGFACNNETLKNYNHLNTTKKRLDERIKICNYLVEHFDNKNEDYQEELRLLINELIIHEGTQKLDESKIYANENAILNKELDEYEGLYNRYITLQGLAKKDIKIWAIKRNEIQVLTKKGEFEYSPNDVEYSENAGVDSFLNIFSIIRERFLYSKFGIVTYLSTRIRHGVFLGELRPELEQNNLIFFKNKLKDIYEPKSIWINNPKLTKDDRNKLIAIITDFSLKIDTLINTIIKQNIQIKLNHENENGWFDYEFSSEQLVEYCLDLYSKEPDYKLFCKKVLEILWIKTDQNLEIIRQTLQGDIKARFVAILNEFDAQLHTLATKNSMPEIFTAVNSCSTNIQNKIDKIAAWFKRSGRTHNDFALQMLINIVCTNVQKAHPSKILEVKYKYLFNRIFKGEYYEHFSDLIRIFIENMFKHNAANNIECLIEAVEEGNNLILIFENACALSEDELIKGDLGRADMIDVSKLITEGKSGFVKAVKIIKGDLKNENNDIYIKNSPNRFKVQIVIDYSLLVA